MSDFNPEWIVGHCSATPPSMADVDAYWIDRLHRRQGWMGCGYHEVITRPQPGKPAQRQNHARGFPCRPITRPGAHVGGCGREWNRITLGICMVGGVDEKGNPEANFHPDQIELFLEAVLEYREKFDIQLVQVIGHRDLIRMTNAAPKACPCISIRALVSQTTERFGGSFNFRRKAPTKLSIPETHKVRKGETLWGISQAYGISVDDLSAWNELEDASMLRVGQRLELRSGN